MAATKKASASTKGLDDLFFDGLKEVAGPAIAAHSKDLDREILSQVA